MTTPAANRPESRYGVDRTPRKPRGIGGKVVAILGVVLLVGIVFAVGNFMMNRGTTEVSVSMASYERIDDDTMRLWVDVSRDDTSVPSYCIVTAINYAMAEVGRREIIMPPGGEGIERIQVDVPSRDYPVSGGTYGCSTNMPAHLDVAAAAAAR